MALKPRVVRTEVQKPSIKSAEGQYTDPTVKPRTVQTEEVKPQKPTAEK